MYVEENRPKALGKAAWIAGFVAVVVLVGWIAFHGSGSNIREEGAQGIRDVVQQRALQCYVVEGIYPPDLKYLEDNYGLEVNTKDYYVSYDIFASNLPPTIWVEAK